MDLNQRQGELLLDAGLVDRPAVARAYAVVASEGSAVDLCQVLIRHGLISPEVASRIRSQATSSSGSASGFAKPVVAPLDSGLARRSSGQFGAADYLESEDLQRTIKSTAPALKRASGATASDQTNDGAMVFGDYVVLRELGRGGMGMVYLGEHRTVKRKVAIKTLNVGASVLSRQRFIKEAETLGRFEHPNIVRLHHFGQHDEQPYLVMDYVEGQSLHQLLAQTNVVEPRRAAEIVIKVTEALDYAHRRAVLHRDLKPANIMIRDHDQEVLLMDFGVAKDIQSKDGMTMTGQLVGTPSYMSPEQVDGQTDRVDQRTDVYALGVVLYELLTGVKPFTGRDFTTLIRAILETEATRVRNLNSAVPLGLELICHKALEKEQIDRYFTARQLGDDLTAFLEGRELLARPRTPLERFVRWRNKNRKWLIIGLLIVVSAILIGLGLVLTPMIKARLYRDFANSMTVKSEKLGLRRFSRMNAELDEIDKSIYSLSKKTLEAEALRREANALKSRLKPVIAEALNYARHQKEYNERIAVDEFQKLKIDDQKSCYSDYLRELKANVIAGRVELLRAQLAKREGIQSLVRVALSAAYQHDSRGEFGSKALLQLADIYRGQDEHLRAIRSYNLLLDFAQLKFIRVSAQLGLIRSYLRLGRLARGFKLIDEIEIAAGLDQETIDAIQWLKTVRKKLTPVAYFKNFSEPSSVFRHDNAGYVIEQKKQKDSRKRYVQISKMTVEAGQLKLKEVYASKPGRYKKVEALFGRFKDKDCVLVVTQKKLQIHVECLRFDNDKLKSFHTIEFNARKFMLGLPPTDKIKLVIATFGDYDGDEFPDLYFFRGDIKKYFLRVSASRSPFFSLKELDHSLRSASCFVDLDGDGRQELVASNKEWAGFSVVVYRGTGDPGLVKPWIKRVGAVRGMAISERADGKGNEVLICADRLRRFDIGLMFGPNLSPDVPDCLWRLRFEKKSETRSKPGIELTELLKFPFEARQRYAIQRAGGLKSVFPNYPSSFFVSVMDYQKTFLTFQSAPGKASITMQAGDLRRLLLCDLDGDGDQEFLCWNHGRRRWQAFGLSSGTTKETQFNERPVALSDSKLAVAMSMIEARDYRSGLEVLKGLERELARESDDSDLRTKLERGFVQLKIAVCYEGLGRLSAACDRLAELIRNDAILRSQARSMLIKCLEDSGRYQEAIDQIKTLLKAETDLEARFRYSRKIGTLLELTQLKPSLDLESALSKSDSIQWVSNQPWQFERKANLLNVRGRVISEATIGTRLKYEYGPLRFQAEIRLARLSASSKVVLKFANELTGQCQPLELSVICSGNGDPISWPRRIGIVPASIQTHNTQAPVQQIEGADAESPIDLRYFRAGAVLKIDSVYRPDIGRLVTQLEYAGMKSVHYHSCQIPAGQYFFSVQLRPTSFQIGGRPRVTANIDILKLKVSGGRDPRHPNRGLELIATKQPTLTNAFLKRDWRGVVDIDPGKYVSAPETNTNKLYSRVLEIGLAKFIGHIELNETDKARVLFQNLNQDKAFFYTWHDAYPKLSRPVRKLLAEMFFSRVRRVDLPDFHANFESAKLGFRSPRLSSDRRRNQFEGWGPDFEALDLLHEHFSGTAIASSEKFRENRLRYYVELGDFESGLAFGQGLTLSTPRFYELQGMIYYNYFDYKKASQFWKRTGKQDYQLPPQILMQRYFAEYVLLREKREGLLEVAGGQ